MFTINRPVVRAAAAALCILAPTVLAAQGGVTIQQHTTFNVAHVTNADLQQTVSILGTDRGKTVTTGKMKVLIISVDAGGTEIMRLDKDSVTKLDDKKKRYETKSLAEKRAELLKQQQDAAKSSEDAKEKDDTRYYAVVDEARRTGEKKVINGFNTEQVSIKITIMGENTKTGKAAPYMHLITDSWIDPSQREAEQIRREYAAAQRRALGADPMMAANPYAKWLSNVDGEMAKVPGYPIRTTLSFESEVDSATAAENRQPKPSVSPLGGAIGGLFGRKKADTAAASGSGRPVLFTSTVEVLSISLTRPAASEFEIPAGYTKK